MFEAIIALIGAVVGVVGGVLNAGSQKYAQRNAEYEANLAFQRNKELALYTGVNTQENAKVIVVICGVIGLVALMYFMSKSNKK